MNQNLSQDTNPPPLPIPELRDIIVPENVNGYWLAPGWIILFVFAVALALVAYRFWRQAQRKNQYRREAQQLLQAWLAEDDPQTDVTPPQLASLSALLKRVAMHSGERQQVAGLHSNAWAQYLEASAPGTINKIGLTLITEGEYQVTLPSQMSRAEIARQCQRWIQKHQPQFSQQGTLHASV